MSVRTLQTKDRFLIDEVVALDGKHVDAWASFSLDRRFRYNLGRVIGTPEQCERRCLFVMLNPSTADAFRLDPTVRRCVSFARREGCGILDVVNVYAYRSTNPAVLSMLGIAAVGVDNDQVIGGAARDADVVVCGWGTKAVDARTAVVRDVLAQCSGVPLTCLGRTAGGHPRHPLYVKGDTPLEEYEWRPAR